MLKVVIIGAGPAGSTAAILLARSGIDVTLVEQHRFPRDKVCGECLSAQGIDVLGRLRLSAAVESLHPIILRRTLLFSPDGESSQITLPRPMWGISRQRFDERLLVSARDAGATVLQPVRCESIGPPVTIRYLETNRIEQIDADFVLVADGKSGATSDLGLKSHFENIDAPRDAIELFGVRGHYGGVAPIEGGRWNVAFSVPERRIRESRGDLDRLFRQIVSENVELARQLCRARRAGEWLVCPLPRSGVGRAWPDRVIPIGNAAASVEPIGGEGMGLAMRSAELAAQMVLCSLHDTGVPPVPGALDIEDRAHGRDARVTLELARLRARYRQLWTVRRFGCRSAALLVSSPKLAGALLGFVQDDSVLTNLALRAIGKSPGPSRSFRAGSWSGSL